MVRKFKILLLTIIILGFLTALGFFFKDWFLNLFLADLVKKSQTPLDIQPVIFQQQQVNFADIRQSLPENIYVEENNIEQVISELNKDTGEKHYGVLFNSARDSAALEKIYTDFAGKNGFLKIVTGSPSEGMKFLIASDETSTRNLNITFRTISGGVQVNLVYSVKP